MALADGPVHTSGQFGSLPICDVKNRERHMLAPKAFNTIESCYNRPAFSKTTRSSNVRDGLGTLICLSRHAIVWMLDALQIGTLLIRLKSKSELVLEICRPRLRLSAKIRPRHILDETRRSQSLWKCPKQGMCFRTILRRLTIRPIVQDRRQSLQIDNRRHVGVLQRDASPLP